MITESSKLVSVRSCLVLALAAWLAGCDALSSESAQDGQAFAKKVPVFDAYPYGTPVDLARGETIYTRHCSGCHGEKGDGQGPAAEWLDPKPRNFIAAAFKFSSTPSGKLPKDSDLMYTLWHGASGTSMPEWRLLPEPDRRAVIAYIKKFSDRWGDPGEEAAPVALGADPFQEFPDDGILHGEVVYHALATCWSCHPAYASEDTMRDLYDYYEAAELTPPSAFRNNLFHSISMRENADGTPKQFKAGEELPANPPDFTWDKIKSGADLDQIALRIATGISGTAMPTWAGILPPRDIWGMAHYVHYLATEHREFPRAPENATPFAERHPYGVDGIFYPENYAEEEAGGEDSGEDSGDDAGDDSGDDAGDDAGDDSDFE